MENVINNLFGSRRVGYNAGNVILGRVANGENVIDVLPREKGHVYTQSDISKMLIPKHKITLADTIEKTGSAKVKENFLKGIISYMTDNAETKEDMGKIRARIVYGINNGYDVINESVEASLKNIEILERDYEKIQKNLGAKI